jgi:hypothetical protein
MKVTAPPRSDQWNAEDFTGGPRTFTIAGVSPGKAEQKYDIELVEGEGRVWRPPLTVLRLLIAAWTDEAATWVGRQVTLYLDPDVRFGGSAVGGIRVSHLSGIEKPLTVPLSVSRGKRALVTVQPLTTTPDPAVAEVVADLTSASSLEVLAAAWEVAKLRGVARDPGVVAAKDKRKAELAAD